MNSISGSIGLQGQALRQQALDMIKEMRQSQIVNKDSVNESLPLTEKSSQFGDLLMDSINKVNDLRNASSQAKKAYSMGDPNVSLAEVVLKSQESSLATKGLVKVRNELVKAYQDLMNMPI